MFTDEQITFLTDLANRGLAEQAEIVARNEQVLKDNAIAVAREAKVAELQAQADQLIATGLEEFDTKIAPTLTAETVSKLVS